MRRLLVIAGAAAMIAGGVAKAGGDIRLNAEIPFEFTVGHVQMPAGRYTVKPNVNGVGTAGSIQGRDAGVSSLFLTQATEARPPHEEAVLVFNRYGTQSFLSEIRIPGRSRGVKLPPGRQERELARNGAPAVVALLAVVAR